MPSLAKVSEPLVATDPGEFAKSTVVMLEKKIRNLEKRKGKLEDYRAKQNSGQTLTEEQLKAVTKLDDVLSQIDLLQDLIKQFNSYGVEVAKQQKKQQKRERFEQIENERKRFVEVLHLQSVLNALGVEETRQAFVNGVDGAIKLEEQELNHLDELYKILNPERGVDHSMVDQLKASSEHLQSVLDARDKPVFGITYKQLNDLISKVKTCSYFTEVVKKPEVEDVTETIETSTEKEFVMVKSEEVPHAESPEVQSSLPPEVLPEQPQPEHPEQMYQHQNMMSHQQPPRADPTKTFEKIVENVQGRFNFIQDSEIDLDSPSHVDPAVVSVHPMPAQQQQYQPQQMVNHSQPEPGYGGGNVVPMTMMVIENSSFNQQTGDGFQQYNMPPSVQNSETGYVHSDAPQSIPIQSEAVSQAPNQSIFPPQGATQSENEQTFDNGMTIESSQKHQDKPSQSDEFQQRGPMHMRRGRGGGYRGGRGNGNGYTGRGGGGYRGGSDRGSGYRGGDRPAGDRARHQSPSGNNGFPSSEHRRGGRGGRGGNMGYRGSGGRGGGGRGNFRGHAQQSANVQ